jgi:hypothetical protein
MVEQMLAAIDADPTDGALSLSGAAMLPTPLSTLLAAMLRRGSLETHECHDVLGVGDIDGARVMQRLNERGWVVAEPFAAAVRYRVRLARKSGADSAGWTRSLEE